MTILPRGIFPNGAAALSFITAEFGAGTAAASAGAAATNQVAAVTAVPHQPGPVTVVVDERRGGPFSAAIPPARHRRFAAWPAITPAPDRAPARIVGAGPLAASPFPAALPAIGRLIEFPILPGAFMMAGTAGAPQALKAGEGSGRGADGPGGIGGGGGGGDGGHPRDIRALGRAAQEIVGKVIETLPSTAGRNPAALELERRALAARPACDADFETRTTALADVYNLFDQAADAYFSNREFEATVRTRILSAYWALEWANRYPDPEAAIEVFGFARDQLVGPYDAFNADGRNANTLQLINSAISTLNELQAPAVGKRPDGTHVVTGRLNAGVVLAGSQSGAVTFHVALPISAKSAFAVAWHPERWEFGIRSAHDFSISEGHGRPDGIREGTEHRLPKEAPRQKGPAFPAVRGRGATMRPPERRTFYLETFGGEFIRLVQEGRRLFITPVRPSGEVTEIQQGDDRRSVTAKVGPFGRFRVTHDSETGLTLTPTDDQRAPRGNGVLFAFEHGALYRVSGSGSLVVQPQDRPIAIGNGLNASCRVTGDGDGPRTITVTSAQ